MTAIIHLGEVLLSPAECEACVVGHRVFASMATRTSRGPDTPAASLGAAAAAWRQAAGLDDLRDALHAAGKAALAPPQTAETSNSAMLHGASGKSSACYQICHAWHVTVPVAQLPDALPRTSGLPGSTSSNRVLPPHLSSLRAQVDWAMYERLCVGECPHMLAEKELCDLACLFFGITRHVLSLHCSFQQEPIFCAPLHVGLGLGLCIA